MTKKIMAGLLVFCMLVTILPITVAVEAAPAESPLIATVMATNYNGTWVNSANDSSTQRYKRYNYYAFNNIENGADLSNLEFCIGELKGSGSTELYYYVTQTNIDTYEKLIADSVTTEVAKKQISAQKMTEVEDQTLHTNASYHWYLKYDLSDITLQNGDTLVVMLPNTGNATHRIATLKKANLLQPQLRFETKMKSSFEVKDIYGSSAEKTAAPVFPKLVTTFIGAGTLTKADFEQNVTIKDNVGALVSNIDFNVTSEATANGTKTVCEIKTPVLKELTTYTISFANTFKDSAGNVYADGDLTFTTGEKELKYTKEDAVGGIKLTADVTGETDILFTAVRKNSDGVVKEIKTVKGDETDLEKTITFASYEATDSFDGFCIKDDGVNLYSGAISLERENIEITDDTRAGVDKLIKLKNLSVIGGGYTVAVLPFSENVTSETMATLSDVEANGFVLEDAVTDSTGAAIYSLKGDKRNKLDAEDYLPSQDMILFVKGEYDTTVYSYVFSYINPTEQSIELGKMQKSEVTLDTFKSVFENKGSILANDMDAVMVEYNSFDPSHKGNIVGELYEDRTTLTTDNIKSRCEKAILTQKIDIASDTATLRSLLDDKIDVMTLAQTSETVEQPNLAGAANQALYGIDISAFKTVLLDTIYKAKNVSRDVLFNEMMGLNITKSSDVKDAFEISAVKGILNNDTVQYTYAEDLLMNTSLFTNISFTEYDKRTTNKDTVLSSVVSKMENATKLSDVKTYFDEAVSETPIPSGTIVSPGSTGSTGGSSGGGGGGGGGNFGSKPDVSFGDGIKAESEKGDVPPAIEQDENAGTGSTGKFYDVDKTSWAYEYIEELSSNQMINGYDDGSFKPENNITRAEFISIIIRAFGIDDSEAKCNFMDVSEADWHYSYIASAFSKGIVNGVNADFFVPESNITREDAAVIIANVLRYLNVDVLENSKNYTDKVSISDYAVRAINQLSGCNIINGYEDGSFAPKKSITRAETCKIVLKTIDTRWGR